MVARKIRVADVAHARNLMRTPPRGVQSGRDQIAGGGGFLTVESCPFFDVSRPCFGGVRTAGTVSRDARELRGTTPPPTGGVRVRLISAGGPPLVEVVDSPNNTRPFVGLFFRAAEQSVGAGCLSAGTASTQIRHIPAGGLYPAGISILLSPRCAQSAAGTNAAMARRERERQGMVTAGTPYERRRLAPRK